MQETVLGEYRVQDPASVVVSAGDTHLTVTRIMHGFAPYERNLPKTTEIEAHRYLIEAHVSGPLCASIMGKNAEWNDD